MGFLSPRATLPRKLGPPQARAMAVQGDRPVTLIDGQALTDLIEKYQLKIHPVTTYRLDDYYYKED